MQRRSQPAPPPTQGSVRRARAAARSGAAADDEADADDTGNRSGPYCWPGMAGNVRVCRSPPARTARRRPPITASLTRTAPPPGRPGAHQGTAYFAIPTAFMTLPERGRRCRPSICSNVGAGSPQTMPKPRPFMKSLNSCDVDLLEQPARASRDVVGQALGSGDAAPGATFQSRPAASLRVGMSGKAGRARSPITARRDLAGLDQSRASTTEQVTMSTPPRPVPAGRARRPARDPRRGVGSMPASFSMPASARCQMPPCPVPEALCLPGLALTASRTSLAVFQGDRRGPAGRPGRHYTARSACSPYLSSVSPASASCRSRR